MIGKPGLWVLSAIVGSVVWLTAGAGAAPWDRLLTLRRVEADPDKSYLLTEENGPWTILACPFSGEYAEQEAKELVLELRTRYKLPAYIYRKKFDFGRETFGRGIDRFGAPLRMQYQQGSEINECAVMVGDYPSVDDPEAQETLQKLKYCRPRCLELEGGRPTGRSLAGWRLIQQAILAPGSDKKKKGPLGHAFITTNPLLSKDYFVPQGIDRLVEQMNEGCRHSLLDCPGKYTVQVAHFTGRVVIDQSEIAALESGKQMKSRLVEAGEKAEQLTTALRLKGYEAYQFHDRYASIVTVGSFDSTGAPRPDGKIEINPKIHAIMRTFGAEQASLPGQPGGALKPKTLVGIPFDLQPIPVQVPRRSIARDYSRDAVRMR